MPSSEMINPDPKAVPLLLGLLPSSGWLKNFSNGDPLGTIKLSFARPFITVVVVILTTEGLSSSITSAKLSGAVFALKWLNCTMQAKKDNNAM